MSNIDSVGFEYKYLDLEQYDYFDTDVIEDKSLDLFEPIGMYLINFSNLEWQIDQAISKLIHDGTDQIGYQIIFFLDFSRKIDLFNNLMLTNVEYISSSTNDKQKYKNSLKQIKKEIIRAYEIRNVVAHANWMTLNHEGFIRTNTRIDSSDGRVKFKYIKLNDSIIYEMVEDLELLQEKLNNYLEDTNLI